MVRMTNHPQAVNGYVLEHRYTIEKKIGRYLRKKEIVHHINGKRDDNRIENLMLCENQAQHSRTHFWILKNGVWFKKCPKCNKIINVETGFGKRSYLSNGRRKYKAQGVCKECDKIIAKERRIKKPDYYSKYFERNREKCLRKTREWRKRNRDYVNKKQREYLKKKRELKKCET